MEEVSRIDDVLKPAKLREFTAGENGELIKLLDLEGTKEILNSMAGKYSALVVTKENYKKEAAKAEQQLRNARYSLQNIHKSNNSFLNRVKKEEKETYDELISLVSVEESRIYNDISAFKEIEKKEKEKEKLAEEKRLKSIQESLRSTEFSLEKSISKAKTEEDLKEFDDFLKKLSDTFPDFQEFEYKAKRLEAIYSGRRGEILEQIEEHKKNIKNQEELNKKKEDEELLKDSVFSMRKKMLVEKGFKYLAGKHFEFGKIKILKDVLRNYNEIEFHSIISEHEKEVKRIKVEEDNEAKAVILQLKKDWEDLLITFEGLGGNPKPYKLRKGQIPTLKSISELKTTVKDYQEDKRARRVKGVIHEIGPFKDSVLSFMSKFDEDFKSKKFKYKESAQLMESFSNKMESTINEIFGGAINS